MKTTPTLAKALFLTLVLMVLMVGAAFAECADGQVNLNTATAEELQQVNGIGGVLAQRIVDYRTEHPFQNLEEIVAVKGIGEKTFEKIQNSLCVD